MKESFQKTVQVTPKIWAMLFVESIIASLLYTILSILGVPKSTSFFITLGCMSALAIFGLLVFAGFLKGKSRTSAQKPSASQTKQEDHAFELWKASLSDFVGKVTIMSHTNTRFALSAVKGEEPKQLRPKPVEISITYSHKDQRFARELEMHLRPLTRANHVTVWSDMHIVAAMNWQKEIDKHLRTANLILILVSPDLLASPVFENLELMPILERYKRGEVRVIPVLVRPVYWQETPLLKELMPLPASGKPLTLWASMDEALMNVASSIEKAVGEILSQDTRRYGLEK